jgi:hypothetical protein
MASAASDHSVVTDHGQGDRRDEDLRPAVDANVPVED